MHVILIKIALKIQIVDHEHAITEPEASEDGMSAHQERIAMPELKETTDEFNKTTQEKTHAKGSLIRADARGRVEVRKTVDAN